MLDALNSTIYVDRILLLPNLDWGYRVRQNAPTPPSVAPNVDQRFPHPKPKTTPPVNV
ncbi:hypothetical protein [Dulcicalothrix desertica]|uniref:hypothetical protein n=1 Tax=Dulcicalothrix desertica TaxID=32056 RepID=UPI001C9994A4|nr:hypothetical protein [Dulcicalothrix desertica]